MDGLMNFQPTNELVGKKSEFKTKEDFASAVTDEYARETDIEDIGNCYVRYFPRGTEDSEMEFGKGNGVYMCVDKLGKGAFECWIV